MRPDAAGALPTQTGGPDAAGASGKAPPGAKEATRAAGRLLPWLKVATRAADGDHETLPGRGLTAIIRGRMSSEAARRLAAFRFFGSVRVDRAAFHAAGDGDHLARHVPGEHV